LKEVQEDLVPALTIIFRKSVRDGAVPEDWKIANVVPIYKKGSKSSPGNYRPISLTSMACKILESIIRDAVTGHLSANNLIKGSQHGFFKNRSCSTNLLEFLERASSVVDEGGGYDVVYLDFAKAFDKVPSKRLLKKIWAHGIRGRAFIWVKEWLTGRKQRVVLNGRFSSWEEVLSGVPQGSVLGPLLFLIFINDLDNVVEMVDVKKFADDTKLGKQVRADIDRADLQLALDNAIAWAKMWGMQFNIEKCKVMHMGCSNPRYHYHMDGKMLQETSEEKDIGVKITDDLKVTTQCAAAAKTALAVLGQITRAFHYRDRHVFVKLYKQYVRPHLEFSTPAWSPWTEGDKKILEKVQQRAVNMVSGLASKTYEERLKELNMETLEERRYMADMTMVRNIMHARGGLRPETWFEKNSTERNLRSSSDPLNIKKRHGRTEMRRNFFSLRVIDHWNAIPSELKKIEKPANFKSSLKKLRATLMNQA
jgi:hypothetical protein